MKNHWKLFLVIAFLFSGKIFAQDNYADAGMWNTFSVDKAINGKFSALFTEECRIKENFTRLNLFYTNLGVQYKVTKQFKAALVYRWIDKFQDDNTFSYRNRIMLDLTFKNKFGNFGISYRQRLQAEKRNIFTSDKGYFTEWYSRNKFEVKYDLSKPFTPFVAAEFRYQIHDFRRQESENTWHRDRYFAGVDYKLNAKSSFGLYYLIQREYNVVNPNNLYILGLEYSLSL